MEPHTPGTPAALTTLLRRAVRLPSLAARYAPFLQDGAQPGLSELPPMTRQDLARATEEALSLWPDGPAASLWAEGGTLASPRLTLLPEDMSVPDVRKVWDPLGPADILANLHPPGRLWPDHYFHHRLAAESGATVLALGELPDTGQDAWLDFLARRGVTAVAASPDVLRRLLGATAAGRPVPWLRTLLLGGAVHDTTPDRLIAEHFPYTEVWRLYGAPGAWITAHRGPRCLPGVYHPLPHQYVEIVGGRLLVTSLDPGRTPPLIRYETQDRGEFAHCVCGLSGAAVRILGAAPPFLRLHGRAVSARELVDLALDMGEVDAAQVAVGPQERVRLRVRLAPGVPDDHHTHAWIRFRVLEGHLTLAACVRERPDLFEVVVVDDLDDTAAPVAEEF
jgi:phenylacetate-CoA ligase